MFGALFIDVQRHVKENLKLRCAHMWCNGIDVDKKEIEIYL